MSSNSENQTNTGELTAQEKFDQEYISASEIMQELSISRPALQYARITGKLPCAIEVNDGRLFLWERKKIRPYLDAWKLMLETRRGDNAI